MRDARNRLRPCPSGPVPSVGAQVRILSVASCARGLPAEDQKRLRRLVGKVRRVLEVDAYGFVWLDSGQANDTVNFSLMSSEVAVETAA